MPMLTFVASALFLAQSTERAPIASVPADSGPAMYQAYCASCHGTDGKGAGPAAKALKTHPGDLTKLAQYNQGVFPSRDVLLALGRVPRQGHGSVEMPIWGDVFRAASHGEPVVQIRIYNLMRYLESIQDPPARPATRAAAAASAGVGEPVTMSNVSPSSGSGMYLAFCASCHGLDGKGDGPIANVLNVAPANLTTLAKRNGGKYPGPRVIEILGRAPGAAAHGSGEMPIWGDRFRANRENDAIVQMRLNNINRYLESLQIK